MKCEICQATEEETDPFNEDWSRYRVKGEKEFRYFCPSHDVKEVCEYIRGKLK